MNFSSSVLITLSSLSFFSPHEGCILSSVSCEQYHDAILILSCLDTSIEDEENQASQACSLNSAVCLLNAIVNGVNGWECVVEERP